MCQGCDFPGGSGGKESAYDAGSLSLIPGAGRSSGEGNGNLLQYSCLRNLTKDSCFSSFLKNFSDLSFSFSCTEIPIRQILDSLTFSSKSIMFLIFHSIVSLCYILLISSVLSSSLLIFFSSVVNLPVRFFSLQQLYFVHF